MGAPHNILMLAFPNAQLLDITGPLQMFAGANDALGHKAYCIQIAAPNKGPFVTSSGVQLVADLSFDKLTKARLDGIGTLLVVGGEPGMREQLALGAVTSIVKRAMGRVPRIASICSGTFFLAAAGALDGKRVATHWSEVDALRQFRPAVVVENDAIHVEDGDIWTSAGVTAGMDLALAMIEADVGRAVALTVARRHVVFRIRPGGQSQFSPELAAQAAGNPKIRKLAERITERPRADWKTDVLAAEAGVSQRSLSRLFRSDLDVSPADFVERVRTDIARRRLLDTDESVETIAIGCGFGSLRRMDRAFSRTVAVSPTQFRARFKTNGEKPCHASTSALPSFPI